MFKRFLPKEERFYDLFRQAADLIVQGAKEFRDMLADGKNNDSRARQIKAIEHHCDEITHRTVELLHRTFITPLDREDIYRLISRMDDILDFIEAAAERVQLYKIVNPPPETLALAEVCIRAAEKVKDAINCLEDLKDPGQIVKHCVEINRLENEADHILRAGMANLFEKELDTRQLIKLKEIYELLETATDRCEDVANVIEGIVLEYA